MGIHSAALVTNILRVQSGLDVWKNVVVHYIHSLVTVFYGA